jgi:thioredoxin reductase
VQESLYLMKFARKVYLVHRKNQLRATKILQERASKKESNYSKKETLEKRLKTQIL